MPCTPGGTTTPLLGLCKPAAGETPWTTAINGNWDILDGLQAAVVARGYLAGLTLSTAGSSSTMTVAAGQAVDSANANVMVLASALNKTTSSWAVGSGNGGLDTGAIAASTWYHFFLIKRVDTNVVDVVFSLSATNPTMPTSYTLKRRIGSGKTDGSSNWTAFVQLGDEFLWSAAVQDMSAVATSATAALQTLTVPTGVQVWARFRITGNAAAAAVTLFTSPDESDQVPARATGLSDLEQGTGFLSSPYLTIRTNTSAQVRWRSSATGAAISASTNGWIDRRGRDG